MARITFVFLAVSLLAPTSRAASKANNYGVVIPHQCKGKEFCAIKPPGYDNLEAKINDLLPPFLTNVETRYGEDTDESEEEIDNDNCPSVVKSESMYTYINPQQNKEMDIIVQTKLFPQKVMTRTCKHMVGGRNHGGSQCFKNLELGNFHLKSRCHQSTATRTLLVYDPAVHKIKTKNYTIPVCCSCKITNE